MALREILAKFGFEVDKSKLDAADKGTNALADKIKLVAGAFAAGAIIGKLKDFVSELKETATNVRRTAQLMGVSTHEAQQWTTAADLAGIGAETFTTGVKFLQKNMVAAAESGGDMAQVFKKLGVEVHDANGNIRPTGEALKEIIGKIAGIKNPAERTAATLKVFGRSGADLLPLINKGAAGLDELLGKLDELGGGLSDEAINALKGQSRASKEFDVALLSLKSRLVTQILPTFTTLIQFGTKIAVGFAKATQGTNVFKAAAILAGTVAVKWALTTYAAYLPLIAGIALLILILDDVITLFKGGDSAAGALIKKLFGKEAGESILKQLGRDLNGLDHRLDDIGKKGGGLVDSIVEVLSTVGGTIVKFIVDDIPEAWDFAMKDLGAGAPIAFKAILDSLIGVAKDFADWANSVADSVINGLVNGVVGGASKVIEAFKNMGKAAFGAIRGVFESHSPSRKLFKFAKQDLAENALAAGLVAGQPAVKEAMGGMYSVPRVGGSTRGDTTVHQVNNHTYQIDGGDTSIANQVRDGAVRANNDDRRELLAALETTG